MLVSHTHRFIYTKTKKTAGTSVESYFEPFCMRPGEWVESHDREVYISEAGIIGFRGAKRPKDCQWWNHMPASQIRQLLGEPLWNEYFKFCVVRNPFDRLVSEYFFERSRDPKWSGAESAADPKAFEAWLRKTPPQPDRDAYMIDGRMVMNYTIRYESLHQDLEEVCQKLHVEWIPERLPTFKSGIRPRDSSASCMYTQRSRDIVQTVYALELESFGYGFPEE
jgi:hypothetical protein